MTYPRDDDEDVIALGDDEWEDDPGDEEIDLGPDERDRDLMDGSWEQNYYAGRARQRDWTTIYTALALLIVLAMVVPVLLAVFE